MSVSRRIIYVAHSSAGRLRLRLSWLRDVPEEAPPLADRLAALNGMIEAAVRPRTGSVLCQYDPERLDETRIVAAVQRHTQVTVIVHPGEESPPPEPESASSGAPTSSLARAVAQSFTAMNQQVLAATDGRLDLGILTSLGFMTAGAAEVVVTRQLPAPPWFNLAWWAVRTFTTFERDTDKVAPGPSVPRLLDRATPRTGPRRRAAKRQRPATRRRPGPSTAG
jgi:hypothetical protein